MRVFFKQASEPSSMKTPVSVLRLPRGPDPNSRGFDPNSPRFIALCPTTLSSSSSGSADEEEQRSDLRERFLRTLLSMTDKQVEFNMHEKVRVRARFGASDIDVLNFQVCDLETPLGVQREALLRCQDVISCSFELAIGQQEAHSSPSCLRPSLSSCQAQEHVCDNLQKYITDPAAPL
ncbi:Gem-associated protein 7 [Anabarilius grahami]|uniref:Gem-associated protein 7 n=1 Tax=Anabarilius grahami TaxID=495550 RepID=A0A3N0Z350_ANAGA|nr:Gem-associated protein 7 [Anabarilius grahami]